jgi:hypothetical protein
MTFLQNIEPFLRIFWFIAIPASLIFVFQSVLTFVGADAGDGIEADFDRNLNDGDSPSQIFSFRNLINFLLGFSWSGIGLFEVVPNKFLLLTVSVAIGIGFVMLFFVIIRQIQKLAEDNTFNIKNVVGKTAQVYLKIPEQNKGKGKIQVSVNGAVHELEAVSESGAIETGALVRVSKVLDGNLISVEKI